MILERSQLIAAVYGVLLRGRQTYEHDQSHQYRLGTISGALVPQTDHQPLHQARMCRPWVKYQHSMVICEETVSLDITNFNIEIPTLTMRFFWLPGVLVFEHCGLLKQAGNLIHHKFLCHQGDHFLCARLNAKCG